ncbi:MAG: hypothetical protein WDO18_16250 [Acidobacteriota bacterium]
MPLNLLVLSDPKASWLKLLERLDPGVNVTITNEEAEVRSAAPNAQVILNGTFTPRMLSIATPLATQAKWMHSLWTGVDNVMSPEVLASPVPLTNGRGVFRVSLAEWTIGAMLHFAYQMRRMIRQQEAGGVGNIYDRGVTRPHVGRRRLWRHRPSRRRACPSLRDEGPGPAPPSRTVRR